MDARVKVSKGRDADTGWTVYTVEAEGLCLGEVYRLVEQQDGMRWECQPAGHGAEFRQCFPSKGDAVAWLAEQYGYPS